MSVMVLVSLPIADGRVDEVATWLKTHSADAGSHPGCILLDAYRAKDNPNTIVFVEQFETRADYNAYLGWREERGDLDYLEGVASGTPSIRYIDLADV